MTQTSTTIRVGIEQRERLRRLASERDASISDTLDAAIEALRRDHFYRAMARAEGALRADPEQWASYERERSAWLDPDDAS